MYKACSRCGKVHDSKYKCRAGLETYDYFKSDIYKLRRTRRWTEKAIEIKKRSSYMCAKCYLDDLYVYDKLEVHHIVPISEDIDRAFDNFNLVCLCSNCHKKADRGEIDRELLFNLARKREEST